MVRFALVNPPRHYGIPVIREDRCEITERSSILPPYSLLQIASFLIEQGHDVHFLDANEKNLTIVECNQWLARLSPEILVFRFTPTTFLTDTKLAESVKLINPSCLSIGICYTLNPVYREVMNELDSLDCYVLEEDYEHIIGRVAQAAEDRNRLAHVPGIAWRDSASGIHKNESRPCDDSLDELPMPAFDYVSEGRYLNKSLRKDNYFILSTSRGCPYSCSFCTMARTKVRMKSPDIVIEEITYLIKRLGTSRLSFFDETFTIDRERSLAICERLASCGYRLRWYCNTRVDCVDKELLNRMAEAGCEGISYGVESGSQRILDGAKKGTNVDEGRKAIAMTKASGITAYASFVLGLPGEDWETLNSTLDFVMSTKPNGAQFNLAVPYPGTSLYELALKKGWIEGDVPWLDLYQHKAHMRTEVLSQEDLEESRLRMYRSLYLNPGWIVENAKHIISGTHSLPIALDYYFKGLCGLMLRGMKHSH